MPEHRTSILRHFRRLRLSLQMMMLAVLIFGGGLGWYIAKAKRQAQTVAAIRRAGSQVSYDWEYRDGKELGPNAKPPWPDWLIQHLGPDYLGNVTQIYHTQFIEGLTENRDGVLDDALAARIGELSRLETLDFGMDETFTDARLSRLSGLKRIRHIYLSGSGVTVAGLVHLKGMTLLEEAELSHMPIRDDDLAILSGMTNLKKLYLPSDLLTDDGLAHLAELTNLKTLGFYSTAKPSTITSRGLAHLASLHHLEVLIIEGSKDRTVWSRSARSLGSDSSISKMLPSTIKGSRRFRASAPWRPCC